jgi:pimeloyl-ACP methyl ester carboxylesterase
MGWHAVAPDQRGHGESPKPDDQAAYSFDVFATDLLGLLDALGWDEAVVLGHSMGGMVLQTAILRAPERFRAIVLMDTSHRSLRGIDPGVLELAVQIALDQGMADLMAAQAAVAGPPPAAHQRLLDTVPGYAAFSDSKLLASAPAMYAAMLPVIAGAVESVDRLEDLRSVAVPTLVIVGEQDTPFIKPSTRMAEAIPDAELAVIPDAAHSPQFENTDAWWKALSTFLERLA